MTSNSKPQLEVPSTLRRRNLKTQQSPAILNLYLRKTRSGKSYDYEDVIVFEKLRFRDGLVCTVGLTVEIKLRFQILWRDVDAAMSRENNPPLYLYQETFHEHSLSHIVFLAPALLHRAYYFTIISICLYF